MRTRHPLAIAFACSLALHAAAAVTVMSVGHYVTVPRNAAGATAEVARPVIVPPPPAEDPLGMTNGLGQALADFEADERLKSTLEGQDQPLLGLSAAGPLRDGLPTAAQLLPAGDDAPPLPAAPRFADLALALGTTGDRPRSRPLDAPPQAEAVAGTQEPTPLVETGVPAEDAAASASDPGPAAGREVDLFARDASADFRAGQAVARSGRDHKIRGIRTSLRAFFEGAYLPRPTLVRFRVRLDDQGTPLEVTVEQSSGSRALDEALRKTLFNSWFDPDPSGRGQDMGKPFRFTIRIV